MDFASRISVTCFAASYAIGMVNEVLRLFWPLRWVRWLATGAALAGLTAQTLFLAAIALTQNRLPIESQFESLITVSWLISLVYLYLLLRDRRLGAGLFILPVSLGLVLYAAGFADRATRHQAGGKQVLAVAHGMLLLFGTVLVVFALLAALMYLVQVRQLKRHHARGRLRLPSLERLDRMNTVAVYVAWPLLTLGIGLGFALRRIEFSDPKVIWTSIAWLLFTVLVHYRHRPENRGRRVALMTIVACAVVLVSVLGDPIFGTAHQAAPGAPEAPPRTPGAPPAEGREGLP